MENCNSKSDFIIEIAMELYTVAQASMLWEEALSQALDIYDDFLNDGNMEFGDKEYDWSPAGAKELAWEYSISYWDE